MKLVFVNTMQELHSFDSTAVISQPPVPLAVLNAVTPSPIETDLVDEQTDQVQFDGDVFAFTRRDTALIGAQRCLSESRARIRIDASLCR
jgi:hypothetical protein